MTTSPDRLLRSALGANAAFSTASGLALALAPGSIGDAMGGLPALALQIVGVCLLAFAAAVVWVRAGAARRPGRVLAVTVADIAWVVASTVFLVLPVPLSPIGIGLVVGIAAVVAVLAVLQLAGLRELGRNRQGSTQARSAFEIQRGFAAPPEVVWPVASALGRIGEFYTALRDVSVAGEGPGAVRTCATHAGQRWSETVAAWDEPGRAYTLRFLSEAPDFPFPVEEMVGGWRVEPDGSGSRVTVWYEFTVRGGWLGDALAPVIASRSGAVMQDVLARMDTATDAEPALL